LARIWLGGLFACLFCADVRGAEDGAARSVRSCGLRLTTVIACGVGLAALRRGTAATLWGALDDLSVGALVA